MFVVIKEEKLLSAEHICQGCLLADHSGLPRWRGGKLGCAQSTGKSQENQTTVYQCQMGFQVANIE